MIVVPNLCSVIKCRRLWLLLLSLKTLLWRWLLNIPNIYSILPLITLKFSWTHRFPVQKLHFPASLAAWGVFAINLFSVRCGPKCPWWLLDSASSLPPSLPSSISSHWWRTTAFLDPDTEASQFQLLRVIELKGSWSLTVYRQRICSGLLVFGISTWEIKKTLSYLRLCFIWVFVIANRTYINTQLIF